jgi:hypothetical protein
MSNDQTVPAMDHGDVTNGQTEAELLDAVLRNSAFVETPEEPLPDEEIPEVDPEYSDEEEDPEESEETVSDEQSEEEADEELDEDGDESEEEESPTQEVNVYTADDLDLDALVRVKIDGEEVDVSFSDLLKGYQTDSSLSKKGRELGEARQALEEERQEALAQVQQMSEASAAVLMGQEQQFSKEYHEIEAKIQKARDEGDRYELEELKDQREQAQRKYWDARQQRERLQGQLAQQKEMQAQQEWETNMQYFSEVIEEKVPGFNEDMAQQIRDFALSEDVGLPEYLVDSIMDPDVIRVLNDYRILKTGVTKGEAKRKAVPAKKAVPTKKAKSKQAKEVDKEKMIKARAFREDASQEDQDAFLKQYAANSLSRKM